MTFESITEAVTQRAHAADALGSTLKFDFGDGQFIHLDGSGAENVVSTEDKEADCTVGITMQDLNDMMEGNLNPMTAFFEQKIKIDGDMTVALKLQELVS